MVKTLNCYIGKIWAACAVVALLATACKSSTGAVGGFRPKGGFVPDAETATKIAVAVWEPIYGKDNIAGEKPYVAVLTNGVWVVDGSLPEGWAGGTAHAEISKEDSKILKVYHGQ